MFHQPFYQAYAMTFACLLLHETNAIIRNGQSANAVFLSESNQNCPRPGWKCVEIGV
jgi:hypothetical protein